ncbi:cobW-domain-containing protein [Phanerochaete sordida]|uniref:CobW-domain-containing protein n=1 Tax=Phanerochaete sordida TaxID=48140 RepID=A0A9P3GLZ2_9APHY|nr:cobW-domain-containing protein [Phanerochaete sordida]
MDDDDIPTLIETDEVSAAQGPEKTVPLTIICGFLGAGKSTLIRRILSEKHGYRIAVIMNDFGDTADIEAKTINVSSAEDPTDTSEEILELANGCLCCSIKDTGVAAIEKLMQRKGAFDHILLETTGLADPGPIASLFWQNEEFSAGLGHYIHLDGVVCMVDAVFGRQQLEEDHSVDGVGESLRQIACADVVLLNKTDLVSAAQAAELEHLIAQVNPAVVIHRTVQGNIDLKNIMGIDAYSSKSKALASDSVGHAHHHAGEPCDEHCDDVGHKHPHHYELRGISSLQVSVPVLSQEAYDRLDEWIRTLLWEGRLPEDSAVGPQRVTVLRCKGIFQTSTGTTYVLQGVRSLYEISPAIDDSDFGLESGKLVFIGKGLDETIRHSLMRVLG